MKKKKYVTAYQTYGGWYILQDKSITVRRLDGGLDIVRPYHIVEIVKWIDTENAFQRLCRRIAGKVLIKLPEPGLHFALMSMKHFDESFVLVREPISRWR